MTYIKNKLKRNWLIKKIRKKKWIKYSRRMMFSQKQINKIIEDPNLLEKTIKNHINCNTHVSKDILEELDVILSKSYLDDIHSDKYHELKLDMLFWYFAYGFSFNEYLCYQFIDKDPIYRSKFSSDRDSVYINYEFNDIEEMQIFNDKMLTYEIYKKYFRREAISLQYKNDLSKFKEFIQKNKKFVKKEVDKACGESVELIDTSLCEYDVNLFNNLISNGKVILEELIYQGNETAIFNGSSVNTIRCITININGKIEMPYFFMKIGRKGKFVDNGGAGGILVGIDPKDGYLCTDGVDEYGHRYKKHPDSGVTFKGYQLPDWDKLVDLCSEMAQISPKVRMIGWDLAYTSESEWIMVEGNSSTEFIGPQSTSLNGVRANISELLNRVKN